MSRFYGGGYYGPRVQIEPERPSALGQLLGAGAGFLLAGPGGAAKLAGAMRGAQVAQAAEEGGIAGAATRLIGLRREDKLEKNRDDELEYIRNRRATMDPIEEARERADLYERGVIPGGGAAGGGVAGAAEQARTRGADLLSGDRSFGDRGFLPSPGRPGDYDAGFDRPTTGLFAPGSFNPQIGGFNPAPIRLNDGFVLDPSLTDEGRRETRTRRDIDVATRAGVPSEHAEAEVRLGLGGALDAHLHPGTDSHENIDPLSEEGIRARIRLEEATERAKNRRGRGGSGTRADLASVERQVDDTRADLARAEREMPTRPTLADVVPEAAARFTADSTAAAGRVSRLQERADSLGAVRDSLAAEVQGRPAATRRPLAPADYDLLVRGDPGRGIPGMTDREIEAAGYIVPRRR